MILMSAPLCAVVRCVCLFVGNCSGLDNSTSNVELLEIISLKLETFPTNAIDWDQTADSFFISKIKDACRSRRDAYKVNLMRSGQWMMGVALIYISDKRLFAYFPLQSGLMLRSGGPKCTH